jgi:hypothetical protein
VALRLLRRRLGTLSKAQQARVQALSVDQLEDLIEALLDFSATADLETWLYADARDIAAARSQLPLSAFPERPAVTLDHVLNGSG